MSKIPLNFHGWKITKSLTNSEVLEGIDKCGFLEWMLEISTPVPETHDERNILIDRWLRHRRQEEQRAVKAKREELKRSADAKTSK